MFDLVKKSQIAFEDPLGPVNILISFGIIQTIGG